MAEVKSELSKQGLQVFLRATDQKFVDEEKGKERPYVEYRVFVNGIWCRVKPADRTAREIIDAALGRE
jgi:hypothetical protein